MRWKINDAIPLSAVASLELYNISITQPIQPRTTHNSININKKNKRKLSPGLSKRSIWQNSKVKNLLPHLFANDVFDIDEVMHNGTLQLFSRHLGRPGACTTLIITDLVWYKRIQKGVLILAVLFLFRNWMLSFMRDHLWRPQKSEDQELLDPEPTVQARPSDSELF